jgi:hypothetical protein
MQQGSSLRSWNRGAIDISQSAVKAILPSMDVVVAAPLNLNAALPTPALAGGQTVRSLRADGTNRAPKRGQQLCCHDYYACRLISQCTQVCRSALQMEGCHG